MRKTIWTVSLIAMFGIATVAQAGQSSKQEAIGVGAGGVIGAVAGGPVGFIVGAAIGAKLGDTLHQKDTEIGSLTRSLDTTNTTVSDLRYEVRSLTTDIESVTAELEQLRAVSQPEVAVLLQSGIATDLLFRTDEHVLPDATGGRLAELAGMLATMPNVQVQLDGFADERGDAAYNQRLSQKRVEFVRDQLIAAGVDTSRISFTAHGEAPAQDQSADSYALERRVSLLLFVNEAPALAANPD